MTTTVSLPKENLMAVSMFVFCMPIVKIKVLTKILCFISSQEVFLSSGVKEVNWNEWFQGPSELGFVSEPDKCV